MKSPGGGCPAERGGGETCTLHHGGGGGGAGLHPQPPLSGGGQTRVIRAQLGLLPARCRPASPPCSCGSTHSSTAHVAEEGPEAQGVQPAGLGRAVTRRPPAPGAQAAHLTAWPPRWACARSRAWPGSSCPPSRAAAAAAALSPRGRPAPGPPSPRRLIHSFVPGPSALRPGTCGGRGRAALPRRATRGGRANPASDRPGRGRCRRQPRPAHHSPTPPVPSRGHGRPGTGSRLHHPRHPNFRNNRKQNSAAGVARQEGPRRLNGACGALWRREAGGAPLPGSVLHLLSAGEVSSLSDAPEDTR